MEERKYANLWNMMRITMRTLFVGRLTARVEPASQGKVSPAAKPFSMLVML